jgi:hypothetical protein
MAISDGDRHRNDSDKRDAVVTLRFQFRIHPRAVHYVGAREVFLTVILKSF